jgi:ligand-binding sensor domain-containing protein
MFRLGPRAGVVAAMAILAVPPASAQGPSSPPAQFLHFAVEDGLSQNTVEAVLRDRAGFLWVGTEEGLNRYDGYSFTTFRHRADRADSLPDNLVSVLHEDRGGQLWVGMLSGVSILDRRHETFRPVLTTHQAVKGIVEDPQGAIWVGTMGEGLYKLSADGTTLRHYLKEDGLTDNRVSALCIDHAGQIWVGTSGGGLNAVDPETGHFTHFLHDPKSPASLHDDPVRSLAEDGLGAIWVGMQSAGLSVLDRTHGTFRHYPIGTDPRAIRSGLVTALYRDRAGTMWLGTGAGLHRHVREGDSFLVYQHDADNSESLSWNVIRSIDEDVQGNLWVGTFSGGLNLLRRSRPGFGFYVHDPKSPTSLLPGSTLSFLEDRAGGLWVGTDEGGVHRFDKEKGTFTGYKYGHPAILSMHQDRRGRIWIGTHGGGVSLFDPASGQFTPYAPQDPVLSRDHVWDIDETADGALWLATDDGLVRLEVASHSVVRYRHDARPSSIGNDSVRALLRDGQGNLWVATLGGLERLRSDGTFVHYRHDAADPHSLRHDWVLSLHEDRAGHLWVGTYGGGLDRLDREEGTFTAYTEDEGLPTNVVYAILEDDDGLLWLGTSHGLCRFDPRAGRAQSFDPTIGLPSRVFSLGAALRTRNGSMLFGTTNGFYDFDPRKVAPSTEVPEVVITAAKVFGEPKKMDVALSAAEEIRLGYRENVFSLEFALLDFTFPRRNHYAYTLEGAGGGWVSLGARRDVTFTNLAPGTYTFRVKGANSDGVWDEKGRAIRIVMTPPFWATWWWRALGVAATFGLLAGAHRLRVRRLTKGRRELEARAAEAVSRVKVLKGLLPICAACKKVRDDRGYWSQIESYLRDHSEAELSHDTCPECMAKRPRTFSRVGALILGILAAGASAEAAPHRPPSRFLRLSTEHGLSNDTVRAILQDRGGFLWIATEDGLSRYDGYGFTVFRRDPARQDGLPDNIVTALCEDSRGRLWVGTLGGLSLFDREHETFTLRLPLRSQDDVRAIAEDRQGALWVGTTAGLYRLGRDQEAPIRYSKRDGDPESLSHDLVSAVHEDHLGRLWIGTFGGGLNLFDPEKGRFVRYRHDPADPQSLSDDNVWGIAEDARGEIWVATNGGGVSVLDRARRHFRQYRFRTDATLVRNELATPVVYRDRSGLMWVGTDGGGLFRYVPEDGSFIPYRHDPAVTESLSGNVIRAIHQDAQGNLWVGTYSRGLNLLRRERLRFLHYTHNPKDPASLSTDSVKCFMEDRHGVIWVGTEDGGLHRFDEDTGSFVRYPRGGAGSIMAIHEDGRGRIWVGTYGDGLELFDPVRGRFSPFRHAAEQDRPSAVDEVWSLLEESPDVLWLGTDDGVIRLETETGRITRRRYPESEPSGRDRNSVRSLLRDHRGDLWIGTLGGVDRLQSDGSLVHYQHDAHDPRSLSHDWAMSLHEDGRGRIWIGTYGGGLNRFDPETETFEAFRGEAGLPSDMVLAILEDEVGRLWLSTSRGLCRFDPGAKAAETYDLTNGLESLPFVPGAALRTRHGSMLFGGPSGFYDFDPRNIAPNPKVPPIALTALRVFAQPPRTIPLAAADAVTLASSENAFSLDFAMLDFTFPRRNRYAYKLEGVDDRWISLGAKRDVTFSRLDPGTYLFRVKGSNADGVWGEKGTSLTIVIRPPFWSTWWWRATALGVLALLLLVAHRARVRRLEQSEAALQHQVEEALSRVKVLRGLLPICPSCKKVRDDQGYWKRIEAYVHDHSEASFSHSICPTCMTWLYPEQARAINAPGTPPLDI